MIIASGLLGVTVIAAFAGLLISVADLRAAAQSARLSEQVLVAANRLERLVVDIEAGERGFLITGQDDRLRLWRTAQGALPEQASILEGLVSDNPEQLAGAKQISLDVDSYVRDYSIPLVAAARRDLAAARTERVIAEGVRRIDAIRAEFDRFMATEQGLAVERQSRSGTAARRATVARGAPA
jgi:CHASE3 domain sensor protein